MEKKLSFSEVLKKYTMVIVLVLVVIMFTANTKGVMLLPQNQQKGRCYHQLRYRTTYLLQG